MTVSSTSRSIATAYAFQRDCDVLYYSGELSETAADAFVRECRSRKRRLKNVLLILVTPGGSAAAAYRVARCLQQLYNDGKFSIFVSGWCKSAGTLLVIGSQELIIGDYGELGPLDVQLGKSDELFEYSSGMTIDSAVNSLEARAMSMFENYFMQIKLRSSDRITFKTATQIASNMVVSLLSPVYGQIDPIKIGENAQEMSVASDYGTRLNQYSQNLKSRRSLSALVESYCSHSFVIDRKEASEIFVNVKSPDDDLVSLETSLGSDAFTPADAPNFGFLSLDAGNEAGTTDERGSAASLASDPGSGENAEVIRANFGGATQKDAAASD